MSVKLMAAVFEADTGSAFNKLVLLALADHAADDGTSVYPSVPTLARKCSLSERSTQRMLRHLEKGGFLVVEAEGHHYSARRYRLVVETIRAARVTDRHPKGDRPSPLEPAAVTDSHPSGDRRTPLESSAVTDGHRRGDRLAPYPSAEPPRVKDEPSVEPTPRAAEAPSVTVLPGIEAQILNGNGHRPVTGKRKHRPRREVVSSAECQQFLAAYPRKEAKLDAEKAWAKLNPDRELVAEIMMALERHKASPKWREEPAFIPHPATWLNGKRWTDEPHCNRHDRRYLTEAFAGLPMGKVRL